MNAQGVILPLLAHFVHCYTTAGFVHFQHFVLAHMALLGFPHCVSETLRLTRLHHLVHWTTPYLFMKRGRWSCQKLSQCLLDLIVETLALCGEIIVAIDDTLVKKWGKHFLGLGFYPDPTDKNLGAHKRRVLGHCWVVLALLWEGRLGLWVGFAVSALLFVPQAACPKEWPFKTKIELAAMLLGRLKWRIKRLILVVDNLYAKAKLACLTLEGVRCVLISRLRSNAALYLPPPKPPKPRRGRPPLRGPKLSAKQLYRRRSQRRSLTVHIYGKTLTLEAFVGVLIPSRTLGSQPILVVIFPQRSGKKMNIFFSTDPTIDPQKSEFSSLSIHSFRDLPIRRKLSIISQPFADGLAEGLAEGLPFAAKIA
jgi:hypothetical protein